MSISDFLLYLCLHRCFTQNIPIMYDIKQADEMIEAGLLDLEKFGQKRDRISSFNYSFFMGSNSYLRLDYVSKVDLIL